MHDDDFIPLPADDRDVQLARQLDEGHVPAKNDAFPNALLLYRSIVQSETLPAALSERLWNRIRLATKLPARIIPLWARWSAAVAAALLLAFGAWLISAPNETLVSEAGADTAVVSLDDGSVITLRRHSAIYRLAHNRYRVAGEAFFDVVSAPDRSFRLLTPLGEVRVLGTRFNVSTWGEHTTVYLETGRLAFQHLETGLTVTLASGDELLALPDSVTVRPAFLDGAVAVDWLSDSLILAGRPFSLILAEIEQHFGIVVHAADSLAPVTLSGHIELSTPEQTLADLGTAIGGRFQETSSNVFRLDLE